MEEGRREEKRTVVMRMRIILRPHIFHHVHAAAFGASFLGAVARHLRYGFEGQFVAVENMAV